MIMMMRTSTFALLSVVALLLTVCAVSIQAAANGFGDSYNWVTYNEALTEAKQQNKPIFLLLHKSWCGACKRLKGEFSNSQNIAELSNNFIMVNAQDEEHPHDDAAFQLDGGYVPRIYFLNPSGEVMKEITNKKGNPSYKYFYYSADHIVDSMNEVLAAN